MTKKLISTAKMQEQSRDKNAIPDRFEIRQDMCTASSKSRSSSIIAITGTR
jgi:hypothetical protein